MANRRSVRPISSENPRGDTAFKKKYGPYPGRPNDRHTKELLDLDANITSTRSLKPSDLNVPIQPCFKRSHWSKTGLNHEPYPLGKLGSGKWAADNDVVWEIIQPTLQLASLLLENIHSDFFDTLLHGPRIPIDPNRFPDNPPSWVPLSSLHLLRSFRSRGLDPQDPALEKSRKDLVSELSSSTTFKFKENSDTLSYNARTNTVIQEDANGNRFLKNQIVLSHKNYEPLLRPNATASERLGYQWRTADTDESLATWVSNSTPEVYFGNHSIQEHGFLMEQFGLGGVTRAEKNPKGSLFPTVAFFWTEWPSVYWVNYVSNVILKTPILSSRYHFYPVPVKHFEDVHQMDFWNYMVTQVPSLAAESLLNVDAGKSEGSKWRSAHATLKSKQNMSAEEQRACQAGDELIKRAKLNEKFFFSSTKQNENLDCILDYNGGLKEKLQLIATAAYTTVATTGQQSMPADPAEAIEALMQIQYEMLLSAARVHCDAVDSYFALTSIGKVALEVKTNLLMFNQGLGGFARELAACWTTELITDYEYIDEILEFRRQMLYSPNDKYSKKFTMEYKEFGDLDGIINAYSKLDTNPEQSKSNIAKMTKYLATDIATGGTTEPLNTIKKFEKLIQALILLLNGEDDKSCDSWKKTLNTLIQRMQGIVGDLRKKFLLSLPVDDTDMEGYNALAGDDVQRDHEMGDDVPRASVMDDTPA
ncbi:d3a5a4c6-a88f-48a7-b1a4-8a223051792e [Sclerotinia trifoliorum]|uniref:D3a5a4c6-a88f-48a7-b1a4-8a223051792e n=1 Tax=Sclerotinia trifoliorum TaxID=28548 RepID=A0A8H2W448_9HELO|nr:d3a5a4c6-a88f-48a7-b1a4-8a223051792e [Sclerotinia trifoliorum]